MLLPLILTLAALVSSAAAGITWPWPWQCFGLHARTIPLWRDLVVDSTGRYPGSFKTVSSAVAALKNTTVYDQTIFVFPGTYTEQVYIGPLLGPLTIRGYTCDSRSYTDNKVTISYNLSRKYPGLVNNDQTSTVRLWTSNVKFYNLNLANTFGAGSQALALSAQNTNQGFYGCKFTGWQDTIYANEGRQIYAKSYVNGAVDFIFGLRAAAWFENIDIETLGTGWITANGREAANNTSFYVFNKCKITGTSGVASTYLGRPWRQFSRVVFQKSYLSNVVNPAGWSRWDAVQPVDNLYYREYKNSGPGSFGIRANFSAELKAPIKAVDILGKHFEREYWVDTSYLE
ncbi:Pectinesterase [Dactylellina cionopaga]|nr:Pectinesterase [Dactylellina cionopaga]